MKTGTRFITAGVLAAALILSMAACGPGANPAKDFEWEENGDGGVTITKYVGTSQTVGIPGKLDGKPVTNIRYDAFPGKELTSVTIPKSVTSLGGFSGNQLTSVIIPDSVTEITDSAFSGNQLTSVTIPDSVTKIGEQAFVGNQLTKLTIGNSVTGIGYAAFENNQLTSVTIPDSVTWIGQGAFSEHQLTSVTIGNSVTQIDNNAFWDNQLTSVVIPDSVTKIGILAFTGSNQLTSVTIGADVELEQEYSDYTPFGPSFQITYNNGGKKAGTYTRPNAESTEWTKK